MVCMDRLASEWFGKQDELHAKGTDEMATLIANFVFHHASGGWQRETLTDLLRAFVTAIKREAKG